MTPEDQGHIRKIAREEATQETGCLAMFVFIFVFAFYFWSAWEHDNIRTLKMEVRSLQAGSRVDAETLNKKSDPE